MAVSVHILIVFLALNSSDAWVLLMANGSLVPRLRTVSDEKLGGAWERG